MSYTEAMSRATEMYRSGATCSSASKQWRVTYHDLRNHLLKLNLVREQDEKFRAATMPTPAEIIERRDAIKAGWSAEEREKRRVGRATRVISANLFRAGRVA